MPSLVFPPPGCENANQFIIPFIGFDLISSNGGKFTNLLISSQDLELSPWYKGIGLSIFTGNYDVLDWYLQDGGLLTEAQLLVRSDRDGETFISSTNPDQFLGQALEVEPNQTYHFSFYAKRGSATDMTYGIYDLTNAENIINPTSYYSQTNSNFYSRINFQCTIPNNCTSIVFFPLWTVSPGSEGNLYLYGPQVELDEFTAYNPTSDISFAKNGISVVNKQNYGIDNKLEFFSNSDNDFEPLHVINGQSNVDWNVEQWYIGDLGALTYSTKSTSNTLYFDPKDRETYRVGETITVSSTNSNFRQNYTIVTWNKNSLTINSNDIIPVDGAVISDAFPSVFDQRFVFKNGPPPSLRARSYTPREAFYMVDFKPSIRAFNYYLDREFFTQAFSNFSQTIENGFIVKSAETTRHSLPPAKVEPRSKFVTINDLRSTGKVRPRSNLSTVIENRNITKIDDFYNDKFALKIPLGIPSLSGTNFIISSDRELGGFFDQLQNNFSIEPYTIDYDLNPIIFVTGQENVKFDFINYHIFDKNLLERQTTQFGPTVKLYYAHRPTDRFYTGHFVKITSENGFSAIAEIKDSSLNSITIDYIIGIPYYYDELLFLQNVTYFYYPKELIFGDLVKNNRPYIVDTPAKSLAASQLVPNYRSIDFRTGIEFDESNLSQSLLSSTLFNEYFYDSRLDSDWSIAVTGQDSEKKYNVTSWYIYDNDLIDYEIINYQYLVLYFSVQIPLFFKQGDQLKIININSGYNKVVTIIDRTLYSVTIEDPLDFPGTSGTFLESNYSSVYPIAKVNTTVQPTNPRERLYYFNLAPGFRYNSSLKDGFSISTDSVNFKVEKLLSASNLVDTDKNQSINFLNKDSIILREERSSLSKVFKLSSIATLRSDLTELRTIQTVDDFFNQSSLNLTTSPTNPREILYYVNLAPGFRNNSFFLKNFKLDDDFSSLISNTVSIEKDTVKIKPVDGNLLPTFTKTVTKVIDDRSILKADIIDTFKIPGSLVQFFETPLSDNLIKDYFKVVSGDTDLKVLHLKKDNNFILKSSETVFIPSTMRSVNQVRVPGENYLNVYKLTAQSILKTVNFNIESNLIEKFLTPPEKTQIFSISNEGKLSSSAKLKSDTIILDVNKLTSSTILKSDKAVISSDQMLEDYFNQDLVSTNVAPVTPRERLYYFNLAPGLYYNSSIQQSLGFEPTADEFISRNEFLNKDYINLKPDNNIFVSEKLSTFDNIGLTKDPIINRNFVTSDPVMPVTGRTSEYVNNVVDVYINDSDLYTISPVGSSQTVTLKFLGREGFPVPFPSGSTITIRNQNVDYERSVIVISGDLTSVLINDPGDLPSISGMTLSREGAGYEVFIYFDTQITLPYIQGSYVRLSDFVNNKQAIVEVLESGNNFIKFFKETAGLFASNDFEIANASIELIISDNVRTQESPKNPRERLFYSSFSPGRFGDLLTVFDHYLEIDYGPLITDFLDQRSDSDLFVDLAINPETYHLEKSLEKLRPVLDSEILVDLLDKYKSPSDQMQVFFTVDSGEILRLKTGDFKRGSVGIRDIASPKKEPIQFWN